MRFRRCRKRSLKDAAAVLSLFVVLSPSDARAHRNHSSLPPSASRALPRAGAAAKRHSAREGRWGRRASVVLQLVTDQDSKERWVSPAVEGETQPSVFSFLFDVVVTRLFSPVFAKFSWTFFRPFFFFFYFLLSFSFSLKKKVYTFHPPTCTYTAAITRVYLRHLRPQRDPPIISQHVALTKLWISHRHKCATY